MSMDSDELYEHFRIEVDSGQEPLRIDKFLTEHMQHASRNRIQLAADAGFVHVNDRPVKSNYKASSRYGDSLLFTAGKLSRPMVHSFYKPYSF